MSIRANLFPDRVSNKVHDATDKVNVFGEDGGSLGTHEARAVQLIVVLNIEMQFTEAFCLIGILVLHILAEHRRVRDGQHCSFAVRELRQTLLDIVDLFCNTVAVVTLAATTGGCVVLGFSGLLHGQKQVVVSVKDEGFTREEVCLDHKFLFRHVVHNSAVVADDAVCTGQVLHVIMHLTGCFKLAKVRRSNLRKKSLGRGRRAQRRPEVASQARNSHAGAVHVGS